MWMAHPLVPRRGSGATSRRAVKALPIIEPDHTEPIHLMNQRRRPDTDGPARKMLRECAVLIRSGYQQARRSGSVQVFGLDQETDARVDLTS